MSLDICQSTLNFSYKLYLQFLKIFVLKISMTEIAYGHFVKTGSSSHRKKRELLTLNSRANYS